MRRKQTHRKLKINKGKQSYALAFSSYVTKNAPFTIVVTFFSLDLGKELTLTFKKFTLGGMKNIVNIYKNQDSTVSIKVIDKSGQYKENWIPPL